MPVYFTTFLLRLIRFNISSVKNPMSKKITMNPNAYDAIYSQPSPFVAVDASKIAWANNGPTHGDHAKLNTNPNANALKKVIPPSTRIVFWCV